MSVLFFFQLLQGFLSGGSWMLHENVSLAGWQGRNIEGIEPVSILSWSSLMLVLRHALGFNGTDGWVCADVVVQDCRGGGGCRVAQN